VASTSCLEAGTAIGRTFARARKGEYTRGGTRQGADAASVWRGDGEGVSPGRRDQRTSDATATKHLDWERVRTGVRMIERMFTMSSVTDTGVLTG